MRRYIPSLRSIGFRLVRLEHRKCSAYRRCMRFPLIALASGFLVSTSVASAAVNFPDVAINHANRTAILELAAQGVITGYADGRFGPEDPVNRAQMLTLLYRLAGKTPPKASRSCFSDVPMGTWFTDVVCDAAAQGYVQGYIDKSFKPGQEVNNAEALKMTFTVLGLPLTEGIITYADVPATEWYTRYVGAALARRMLPLPGQTDRFEGGRPLLRGAAAQLLYHISHPVPSATEGAGDDGTVAGASASVTSAASASTRSRASRTGTSVEGYTAAAATLNVELPFSTLRVFPKRETVVHAFTLTADATQVFRVVTDAERGPECRLYRIEDDGLTFEYYTGARTGKECWMRVAMSPGTYQLEVTADAGNVRVSSEAVTGDGSDGFRQAKPLARAVNVASELLEDDHGDWFRFDVAHQQRMTVTVENVDSTSTLDCVIYPLKNVNFFGFDWPACNAQFLYEKGSYVIGVMHSESALKLGQRRGEAIRVRIE